MEIVREIALINDRRAMDAAEFAFAVAAIRTQLVRDFLPVWQPYMPVKRPLEVAGYTDSKNLAPGSFAPIVVLSSLDTTQVLGDHGGIEALDSAWGRSLPQSTVMSHEALELAGDPFGNRWVRLPSGIVTPLEVCDAVENDFYAIRSTVGGQSRDVWVSNFVYPAFFGEGVGQLDHMGLCKAPGDNRGYLVVQQPDGTTINVFADGAGEDYRAGVNSKLARMSRTSKRYTAAHRSIIDAGTGASWA